MAKGSSGGASYLKGLTETEATLNREIEGIKARSMKGLIMSAAFIRNETEKTPPLTPVDLGNLRASWFVVTASRVAAGSATHQFKGPKAAELSSSHSSTIAESQGLVASQSTASKKFLMMGYGANYSGYVHEMIGADFKKTGAGPKWLETHIKKNAGKIVQIVKDNAQIKK